MKPFNRVADVYRHIEQNYSNPKALNYHSQGHWHSVSSQTFVNDIKRLTLALNSMGLNKGDKVGILAPPSPNWSIADFAIILAGGVSVPLFANISDENFVFEVTQSQLKVLFIAGPECRAMYEKHKELFDTVILLEDDEEGGYGISFKEALHLGDKTQEKQPELFDNLLDSLQPDDIATIIYTSGSTGVPKGVVLPHSNLLAIAHTDFFRWDALKDRYLSIIPLAHVFGRALNFFLIVWGVSIYYFNQMKNLGAACKEVHPTIVVVVPRILEKIHGSMLANIQRASLMKRKLGQWAFDLAENEDDNLFKQLLMPIADKIVYSALREALGGSLRIVISGGAPLDPHLCRFFIEIGVPIYEGWGLTEAHTVCVNRIGNRKIGTVGPPIVPMEVRVSEEGELLIKGPIVLKEYYKNPDATAKVLDKDGWFHTGDRGFIDNDGFVTILGRIKELYKTSTGEYIAPVPIEQAICKAPLIDLALVIGEGKKFASALLFPNFEVLESLKAAHSMSHLSNEEFLNSEFVKKEMDKLFDNLNAHLNHWEQIHAYRFVPTPPTIETGELTPSMKIRRDVVAKKYKHLIDSMYTEEAK